MKYKQKSFLIWMGSYYPWMVSQWWVENRIADAALIGVSATGMLWALSRYVKGDPEEKAKRQKEIEKARTRELELQLGYEPLDFSEMSDDEVNRMYEEMKKEKGS